MYAPFQHTAHLLQELPRVLRGSTEGTMPVVLPVTLTLYPPTLPSSPPPRPKPAETVEKEGQEGSELV